MAGKPKQVSEREARGDVERVLYEMRETLRVTGLDVTVRTWAGFERFLVEVWEAMESNTQTRAFEAAADEVRAQAVGSVEGWERLGAWEAVPLGESQRYQLKAALELYHDMNPKMLVLTCAVRMALGGEVVGGLEGAKTERLRRGAPARMAAMEWVSERPDDLRLRALFKDILRTLGPPSLPGEYRALALWPEYLAACWERLKPAMGREPYERARAELLRTARRLARELPYEVELNRAEVSDLVVRVTEQFERRLPALVLNVAALALDAPEVELRRPFPAETRWEAEGAAGGLQ